VNGSEVPDGAAVEIEHSGELLRTGTTTGSLSRPGALTGSFDSSAARAALPSTLTGRGGRVRPAPSTSACSPSPKNRFARSRAPSPDPGPSRRRQCRRGGFASTRHLLGRFTRSWGSRGGRRANMDDSSVASGRNVQCSGPRDACGDVAVTSKLVTRCVVNPEEVVRPSRLFGVWIPFRHRPSD